MLASPVLFSSLSLVLSLQGVGVTSGGTRDQATPSLRDPGRVTLDLRALYDFAEGAGNAVRDVSGAGAPLDLAIDDASAVTWLPGGGLAVEAPAVIRSQAPAAKIIDAVQAAEALTVEAWVVPAALEFVDVARIAAISKDGYPNGGNTALTQATGFGWRLRTSSTDQYGLPALTSPPGLLQLALTHVVCTRDAAGERRLFLDGEEVHSDAVPGSLAAAWNDAYTLTLANEPPGDRPWLGELHLVAFYSRAISAAEVAQNFAAGPDWIPTAPPSAPTDLAADAVTALEVRVTWTDTSDNEAGFAIERSEDGGATFAPLLTAPAGSTVHSDTTVAEETGYCYRVRATNPVGSSAFSGVDCATTPSIPSPPAAPSELAVTVVSVTQVDLTWVDNADNEEGFELERSVDGGASFTQVAVVHADIQAFADTEALPVTERCYRVRAVNVGGPSEYTGVECATTPASEMLMFEWDELITVAHHGFAELNEQLGTLPDNAHEDWTLPPQFGNGSIHFRAEVRSTPAGVSGHLQICLYQTIEGESYIYGIENCGSRPHFTSNPPGGATTVSLDSFQISGMWQLDDVPIDWTRSRTAYDIAVWDENYVNVTDWLGLDWGGHDPDDWYPMDLRFTAVVVAPGASFSGWENYP